MGIDWEQDTVKQEQVAYVNNPRVKEARVGDEGNTKRTTIHYKPPSEIAEGDNIALYGLEDRTGLTCDFAITTTSSSATG
ncbi:MAG: hypothetical protein KBD94_06880 [Pyrinomonadaceae bacterium]|nr:hypothetical protein [Pyrinomonadaceae bacterium]